LPCATLASQMPGRDGLLLPQDERRGSFRVYVTTSKIV